MSNDKILSAGQSGRNYPILFALNDLNFRSFEMQDPQPLGRQILATGGCDIRDGYSLFAILPSGDFEDIRLDELFDLQTQGAERFVAFNTDRDYKLTVDDRQIEWGKPVINGASLYMLTGISEEQAIFLEVRGGQDQLIEPADLVDLNKPGIERFITAPRPSKTYEIIVNSRQHEVLGQHLTYEEIVQLAFPGAHDPNVIFSITYRHAASNPHAGDLSPGGTVKVKKEGTIFNVTRTVQS